MNRALVGLVLILAAVLAGLVWRDQVQKKRSLVRNTETLFNNMELSEISELNLELPSGRVSFSFNGQHWVFKHHPKVRANAVYLDVLLQTLLKTGVGTLVSENAADHEQYGLGSSARVIIARDAAGRELTRLYVGKPAGDFRSTYVRLRDETKVRFVTADLIPLTSRATWADTSVWQVPESGVTRAALKIGTEERVWHEQFPGELLDLHASDVSFESCDVQNSEVTIQIDVEGVAIQLGIDMEGRAIYQDVCYLFSQAAIDKLKALKP
ncbi:MAG: DUF4340 domain-containing protein [Acidobacteria bacterium]|nr:DUF4340 domain-containing protein [Acidobacteriota bacterium]